MRLSAFARAGCVVVAALSLLTVTGAAHAVDYAKKDVYCGDDLLGTMKIDMDSYKTHTANAGFPAVNWLGGVNIDGIFDSVVPHTYHYVQVLKTETDTFRWINDVLGELSRCVQEEGGVLVDYIGDELMAMWGAPAAQPDQAVRAVRAGLKMQQALPALD